MDDLKLINQEYLDLNSELFRGKSKLCFNINQIQDLCKNRLYENIDKRHFEQ